MKIGRLQEFLVALRYEKRGQWLFISDLRKRAGNFELIEAIKAGVCLDDDLVGAIKILHIKMDHPFTVAHTSFQLNAATRYGEIDQNTQSRSFGGFNGYPARNDMTSMFGYKIGQRGLRYCYRLVVKFSPSLGEQEVVESIIGCRIIIIEI